MAGSKRCKAKTKSGTRCKSAVMPGSEFCFFHDPECAEESRAAKVKGGLRGLLRTLPADTPDVIVDSCQAIVRLICETISQVRRGEIDPKIANSIGYLANVAVRALESSEIEDRIKALEERMDRQSESPRFN